MPLTSGGWEPPEGGGLLDQRKLIDALVLFLLVADVLADHGLVSPYGRDEVSARPKVLPNEVPLTFAERSRDIYQERLTKAGFGPITTEILPAPEFYYAEDYHQQYLAKNPRGYCGHGGTGIACPVGVVASRT